MQAICLRSQILVRTLHTSSALNGSNKEWLALKRHEKAKKDRAWAKRENADQFFGNVGVRHELKAFGLRDASDPVISSKLAFAEMSNEDEISEKLEQTLGATTKFQKELHGNKRLGPNISKEVLRRILTKKNYFPDPKSPSLLTYMEKETIKSLHNQDPVEWSLQRLSECFPATPSIIKKVLKNRNAILPSLIERHDDEIARNWRQLLNGEIQVSDELMQHLAKNCDKISSGVHPYMSDAAYKQLEVSIQQNLAEINQPVRRLIKGQFGQIIADYKKKVELIGMKENDSRNEVKLETEVIQGGGILAPEPEFWVNLPTPYGETTMIKTSIDYRRERSMTMEEFKKRFLDQKMTTNNPKKGQKNVNAQLYFDWFKNEMAKDNFAKANPVQILSEKEIEQEVMSAKEDRFIQLPKKYLQQKSSKEGVVLGNAKDLNTFHKANLDKSNINLRVEIPESDHKPGAIYKMNNCYYDSNGDFLYKAP